MELKIVLLCLFVCFKARIELPFPDRSTPYFFSLCDFLGGEAKGVDNKVIKTFCLLDSKHCQKLSRD